MKKLKTQLKIRNLHFLFVIFSFSFFVFLFTNSAVAAKLFFVAGSSGVRVDEQIEIEIIINTENEDINALEGKIIFPAESLELKEIRDGNSIVSLWLERPRPLESGVITFSGIIPGGYNNAAGSVFSLVFRAKDKTTALIKTSDIKILLNDGQGSSAAVESLPFNLQIYSPQLNSTVQPAVLDNYPPEEFTPIIGRDENIFDGQWFLAFATQDKNSGIDYYAVAEKRGSAAPDYSDLNWQKAESPHCLKDQALKSFIYVKAVDRVGNARIGALLPTSPLVWYEKYWLWIIIGLGMVLAGIAGLILKRRISSRIN